MAKKKTAKKMTAKGNPTPASVKRALRRKLTNAFKKAFPLGVRFPSFDEIPALLAQSLQGVRIAQNVCLILGLPYIIKSPNLDETCRAASGLRDDKNQLANIVDYASIDLNALVEHITRLEVIIKDMNQEALAAEAVIHARDRELRTIVNEGDGFATLKSTLQTRGVPCTSTKQLPTTRRIFMRPKLRCEGMITAPQEMVHNPS